MLYTHVLAGSLFPDLRFGSQSAEALATVPPGNLELDVEWRTYASLLFGLFDVETSRSWENHHG